MFESYKEFKVYGHVSKIDEDTGEGMYTVINTNKFKDIKDYSGEFSPGRPLHAFQCKYNNNDMIIYNVHPGHNYEFMNKISVLDIPKTDDVIIAGDMNMILDKELKLDGRQFYGKTNFATCCSNAHTEKQFVRLGSYDNIIYTMQSYTNKLKEVSMIDAHSDHLPVISEIYKK